MPHPAAPPPLAAEAAAVAGAGDARVTGEPTPRAAVSTTTTSSAAARAIHHKPSASEPARLIAAADGSRRGSTTQPSESAGSSPTSTASTLDSALTSSSPSSSPESPTSSLPMHSFSGSKSTSEPTVVESPHSTHSQALVSPAAGFDAADGAKRARKNVRGLSINTKGISTRPATAAGVIQPEPSSNQSVPAGGASAVPGRLVASNSSAVNSPSPVERPLSEPTSPSFIVPTSQPSVAKRRSKLGLTISTPEKQQSPVPANGPTSSTPGFAATLAQRRSGGASNGGSGVGTAASKRFSALKSGDRTLDRSLFSPVAGPPAGMSLPPMNRHHTEPALPTPAFAPEGGMSLPPLGGSDTRSPSQPLAGAGPLSGPTSRPFARPALTLTSHRSFDAGAVVQHTVEHTPDFPAHDLPLSREVKSPSYPHGPACIYPPNVFLYHQPTADEAREFDVIINVAKEVPNPFEEEAERQREEREARGYTDAGVQCDLLDAPPLQLLTAEDVAAAKISEPATPKTSTPATQKEPEYIHLPWEHNSHVFEEWLEVCELIDRRVKEHKKVLIHCQLGVSRSASLIVAYGLYKNPGLTPHEAREQAKEQSRWIDLNMHFMYELGDFRKILLRKFPDVYVAGRDVTAPALVRTKTEGFLSTTSYNSSTEKNSSQADADGRRASSADGGLAALARSPDEMVPASAPVSKVWSAAESVQRHNEMYDAAAAASTAATGAATGTGKTHIATIPEHGPAPGHTEGDADGEGEGDGSDASTPKRENQDGGPRTTSNSKSHTPPESIMMSASISDPAKDLPDLSRLRWSQDLSGKSRLQAQSTTPVPPVPALPGGFASLTTATAPRANLPTLAIRTQSLGQGQGLGQSQTKSKHGAAVPPPPNVPPPSAVMPVPSTHTSTPSIASRAEPLLHARQPSANIGLAKPVPASLGSNATSTAHTAVTSNTAPAPTSTSTALSASTEDDPLAPALPPLDFGSASLLSPRTNAFVTGPFARNSLAVHFPPGVSLSHLGNIGSGGFSQLGGTGGAANTSTAEGGEPSIDALTSPGVLSPTASTFAQALEQRQQQKSGGGEKGEEGEGEAEQTEEEMQKRKELRKDRAVTLDPRSPAAQAALREVTRSIDDVL